MRRRVPPGAGGAALGGPAGFGVSRVGGTGTATAPSGGNGSVWAGTVRLQLHPTATSRHAAGSQPSAIACSRHQVLVWQGWTREMCLLVKDTGKREQSADQGCSIHPAADALRRGEEGGHAGEQ